MEGKNAETRSRESSLVVNPSRGCHICATAAGGWGLRRTHSRVGASDA
jgi:hypothetical protein